VSIEFLLINTSEQFHACVSFNLVAFVNGSATVEKRWVNRRVQALCAIG